ncbi:MAG: hypothetical protein Q9190_003010 [Brigantiaea leucoxantha]
MRGYLQGPSHDVPQVDSSEDEECFQSKFATVARDVRRRLSRADSSISQPASIGPSLTPSTSRLLMQSSNDTDFHENNLIKEQIREKVWIDSLTAQNHMALPGDKNKPPDSVNMPIRRRSLYTPGIATRTPEDILRKPPPLNDSLSQVDKDYYFNPALSESSPLSFLAQLQPIQSGRSTPSDLTHIGGLRLGTLRVTNGTASPIPWNSASAAPYESSTDLTHSEDYHSLSEYDDTVADSTRLSSCDPKHCLPMKAKTREAEMESANTNLTSAEGRGKSGDQMEKKHLNTIKTLASEGLIRRKPLPTKSPIEIPNDASSIAHDYISELPPSPFVVLNDQSLSMLCSNAVHEEDQYSEMKSQDGVSLSREAAFLALNGVSNTKQEIVSQYSFLTPSTNPRISPASRSEKSLEDADSGYKSNESQDSLFQNKGHSMLDNVDEPLPPRKTTASFHIGCEETQKQYQKGLKGTDDNSLVIKNRTQSKPGYQPSLGEIPASPYGQVSGNLETMRKLQKRRPHSQPPPLDGTFFQPSHDYSNTEVPAVPQKMVAQHAERLLKFPVLECTYPSPQHTTTDEAVENPRQKAVQARVSTLEKPLDEQIESPSPSLLSKVGARVRSWSRSRSRSRSRPRTKNLGFSDDSAEQSSGSEICRSPTWSEFGNRKKKEQRKLEKKSKFMTKEAKKAQDLPMTNLSSRQAKKSARRPGNPLEASASFADFGTVARSIGENPYDIAKPTLNPVHHKCNSVLPYPHQINSTKPRAKSMYEADHAWSGMLAKRQSQHSSQSFAHHDALVDQSLNDREGVLQKTSSRDTACGDPTILNLSALQQNEFPLRADHPVESLSEKRQQSTLSRARAALPKESEDGHLLVHNLRQSLNGSTTSVIDSGGALITESSMDDLNGRLLCETDQHVREEVPQQLRQSRQSSTLTLVDNRQNTSARQSGTLEPKLSNSGESKDGPFNKKEQNLLMPLECASSPRSRDLVTEAIRHQSLPAGVPPVPPLPLDSRFSLQGKRLMKQRSSWIPPQKTPTQGILSQDASESSKFNIENRKSEQSHQNWDIHSRIWSDRRKSAGEALLLQRHATNSVEKSAGREELADEQGSWQPAASKEQTPSHIEVLPDFQCQSKSFHKPWAPAIAPQHLQAPIATPVEKTNIISDNSTQPFERFSGRYEGGLSYGYEPGFGLGGSAGTRSTRNGATRKSIHFSQGFGVDLSDVPIFIRSA